MNFYQITDVCSENTLANWKMSQTFVWRPVRDLKVLCPFSLDCESQMFDFYNIYDMGKHSIYI